MVDASDKMSGFPSFLRSLTGFKSALVVAMVLTVRFAWVLNHVERWDTPNFILLMFLCELPLAVAGLTLVQSALSGRLVRASGIALFLALVEAPLLAQSTGASSPVQHYGYSGQDKMLECIQRVFGKYSAGFPHTVLYGNLPITIGRPPRIVDGHWEPVSERISFPPLADLPCPSTRDRIAKLLDSA